MFFNKCLRSKPQIGNPLISYPAAGTRCISILPRAPTKRIFASGRFALIALAIDIAGKICPPVPPPLMIILSSFSIILFSSVLSQHLPFIVSAIMLIFKFGVAVQNLRCRFGCGLCFRIGCGIRLYLQLDLCIVRFLFFQMSGISAYA